MYDKILLTLNQQDKDVNFKQKIMINIVILNGYKQSLRTLIIII